MVQEVVGAVGQDGREKGVQGRDGAFETPDDLGRLHAHGAELDVEHDALEVVDVAPQTIDRSQPTHRSLRLVRPVVRKVRRRRRAGVAL